MPVYVKFDAPHLDTYPLYLKFGEHFGYGDLELLRDVDGEGFYTVTDRDTEYTNSRSRRYATEAAAIEEANNRLLAQKNTGSRSPGAVYILKAIAIVEPAQAYNVRRL